MRLDVYRIFKQTFEEHEKNHNLLHRKKNIYHTAQKKKYLS